MGNALVDILLPIKDDSLLNFLGFPKGSMQLVDEKSALDILAKTNIKDYSKVAGGSAANTIHALATLGINTGFIGKVGKDEMGSFFKSQMQENEITPHLFESDTISGRATTLISPDSERTFATFLGAAVELSAEDLTNDIFVGYDYFHIEGYLVQNHKLLEESLILAKKNNLKVSLDLASFNVVEDNYDFLHEMTSKYVDILFANEEEGKSFTKLSDENKILDKMSEIVDIAVLKLGSKGSLIKSNNIVHKVGIRTANPVDTTGAGDFYAAGFLFGLINNMSFTQSGEIGALLSANVIEVVGPKLNNDRWQKIKSEIRSI